MNTEKVYKVMDSALEQYRLNKSDVNFGRAWGAANLAFELSIITFDQFDVYIESLIWEKNNSQQSIVYCTVSYFSTVHYGTYQSRRSACELTQ